MHPRHRITLASTTSHVRDRRWGRRDKQRRDGSQHIHLLTRAVAAVIGVRVPLESARPPVGFARAGRYRRFGRGLEDGEDFVGEERSDLRGGRHPAVQVAFEAEHVGCAGHVLLAGELVGDVVGEEGLERGVGQLVEAVPPNVAAIGLMDMTALETNN